MSRNSVPQLECSGQVIKDEVSGERNLDICFNLYIIQRQLSEHALASKLDRVPCQVHLCFQAKTSDESQLASHPRLFGIRLNEVRLLSQGGLLQLGFNVVSHHLQIYTIRGTG